MLVRETKIRLTRIVRRAVYIGPFRCSLGRSGYTNCARSGGVQTRGGETKELIDTKEMETKAKISKCTHNSVK